jgi:hypothetical protein
VAPKPKKASPARGRSKTLPAPRNLEDPVELADWLELMALSSRDRNASKGDLSSLLKRAGVFQPANEPQAVEALCLATFAELDSRLKAAAGSYPFQVALPLIKARAKAFERYPSYIFCLCLSAWRWINPTERPSNARQLFEDLSCFAAKTFFGGEVLRLASPRGPELKEFPKAIQALCQLVGEGGGYRKGQPPKATKDDTLDVVAWRHFPDGRYGKLVLLGQCASGKDWLDKRSELQPEDFMDMWMSQRFTSRCIKAFFIPHRLDEKRWEDTTRKGGIPFDRCRVAYWAQQYRPLPKRQEFIAWSKSVIPIQ